MKATVIECHETTKNSGIFLLEFFLKKPMKVEPGQFITLEPLNPLSVMQRPFSVYPVSTIGDRISIKFKVVGKNTKAYSELKPNDQIKISGPKGNPIPLDLEVEDYILVGGGIGTVVLIPLAEKLKNSGKSVKVSLGAKNPKQLIEAKVLEDLGRNVKTITETGRKHTGFVTDLLEEALAGDLGKSTIIACGPVVMLEKVAAMTAKSGNKCLVLLEEFMACGGVGSCKGDPVFGKDETVKYICQDGPAFDASWVDWGKLIHRYEIAPLPRSGRVTDPFKTILTGQNGRKLKLATPIMNASGCLDIKAVREGEVNITHAGALIPKAITLEGRPGNEGPRVCEVTAGMLNSIGLAGKGVKEFLEKDLPQWLNFGLPVIINIAGSTVAEYVKIARRLANTGVAAFEVNISCPNVHGGMAFGVNPRQTFRVVRAVREAAPNMFLIVKLTPTAGFQIVRVAEAAVKAGADAISLINTFPGLAFNIRTRKAKLGKGSGGLSGPAIQPIALWMIREVYKADLGIPIIGIGGIGDGDSAMQAILAGASTVQVGTALFKNGNAMPDIYRSLLDMISYHKVSDISELIGQGVL